RVDDIVEQRLDDDVVGVCHRRGGIVRADLPAAVVIVAAAIETPSLGPIATARSDLQRTTAAAADREVGEQILRGIPERRPAEKIAFGSAEVDRASGLPAALRGSPCLIADDPELWNFPADPFGFWSGCHVVSAEHVPFGLPAPDELAAVGLAP